MVLKGSAFVSGRDGSVKVTGKVTDVSLTDFTFTERKCAECMQVFENNDKVLLFNSGVFNTTEEGNEIQFIPENTSLVHLKCLEDFIARYLQSDKSTVTSVDGNVVESKS